ncbi:MAG: hypothetical protein A2756_04730 [Candidatus Ryanbacteria bacterium RIFCSPHIGHO2_01_FULL_48_27]|uniref:Uncharacterized protein n=1 Tax=Candidatus Ryanbacteria bacterium RIFCSPHIGHO2_01_FULL_48_27 TaxID=1802115 RepID=A0A1G2G377_9BACT|nr:MAG: hypothetical protein A2756_04730 [Candidatus Ryanbacteria bacterium RIFCSPHIGHO2_01_FULL_48_27]
MHKNATFLILFGTLLVTGGVVVLYGNQQDGTTWQKTLERVSGTWKKDDNRQKLLEPTEPSAGPFPFAERVVDPITGWILFSQPKYVPISFLYPPEFEQTGAHRFEWGGTILTFFNAPYYLRLTIGGEGKGLPLEKEYGTSTFNLEGHVFQFTLLEGGGITSHNWRSLPTSQRDELAKILNLTPGLNILMVEIWCSPSNIESCTKSEGRRLLHDISSSIHLAFNPR